MTEIWKDVKGYEGLYKVSNHGKVWSVRSQKLLKKFECSTGYYAVTLLSRSIVGVNIKDGELIEFSSLSEANRNGYHKGNIWACINGRQSTHRGHRWFYKQDYI